MSEQFTKYEKARIIGARALQIAMNAPLLVKISKEDLEKIRYDSLKIAELEFNIGILPISINKPFPRKKQEKLRKIKERKIEDKKIEEIESEEEKEIVEKGEIMQLANLEEEEEEISQGETE